MLKLDVGVCPVVTYPFVACGDVMMRSYRDVSDEDAQFIAAIYVCQVGMFISYFALASITVSRGSIFESGVLSTGRRPVWILLVLCSAVALFRHCRFYSWFLAAFPFFALSLYGEMIRNSGEIFHLHLYWWSSTFISLSSG